MRKKATYIYFLILTLSFPLAGQESISLVPDRGCDSLRVAFTLVTSLQESDYSSIEWRFGDGASATGSLEVNHLYTDPGIYNPSCILNGSTTISAADPVTVGETPYAEIRFRDSSATGTEFRYFLYPGYYKMPESDSLSYRWTLPDLSAITDSTVLFPFDEAGIFPVTLEITNRAGCTFTTTRKIPVSKELLVPNVFSPNDDEINDLFRVSTTGDYTYTTRIYNRSGVLLYFSESPTISWDGRTITGQDVPEGVYYYVIQSDETPVQTRQTGTIHLYR